MALLDSVLWTKGTLLTPQHLQAQDRYFDELVQSQVGALHQLPWGLTDLEIDRDALRGGNMSVRRVGGRFNDGLLFAATADVAPPTRSFAGQWRPDQRTLNVFLAVGEYRVGARNVAVLRDAEANSARWRAEERAFRDETTGLEERPIQIAQANLRLLFESESREGYLTMPIARLTRSATGEVDLDPQFVPPLLNVAASEFLQTMGKRILERVSAKASSIAALRRQRNQGLADFSITDVASFWLLYTLNSHQPLLRHLVDVRPGHPMELWEELLALTSALTTFATSAVPLPTYDHMRLGPSFAQLEARLMELLDTAVPETAVALSFRAERPSIYNVAITKEQWFDAPQWYLAVSAPLRQVDLHAHVMQRSKLGSSDLIDILIGRALGGLELQHVPQPPPAVPMKGDFLYFLIRRAGDAWNAVLQSRKLSLYLPNEIPSPRAELVIVLR
jgi:type VI secretion system protein ImpJ